MKGVWKVDGFYKADASKVLDELSELGDEYWGLIGEVNGNTSVKKKGVEE